MNNVRKLREVSQRGYQDQGQSWYNRDRLIRSVRSAPLTSHCGQLAAPKSKYIEHILIATHAGEAGVAEIFRTLQFRFRDSTWTIVFKALIVVHLMIREGELNATLQYLAEYPKKIAISTFSEG